MDGTRPSNTGMSNMPPSADTHTRCRDDAAAFRSARRLIAHARSRSTDPLIVAMSKRPAMYAVVEPPNVAARYDRIGMKMLIVPPHGLAESSPTIDRAPRHRAWPRHPEGQRRHRWQIRRRMFGRRA